jgi:hypothetical protein
VAVKSRSSPTSSPRPKRHRRSDHVPRHVREEHRVARTAAAGAAGAVVIGAALGLTSGSLNAANDPVEPSPAGANLDDLLAARSDSTQAASRGLARAEVPGTGGTLEARAQGPAVQAAQDEGVITDPLPPVPADCEEFSGNRQLGCSLLSEFGFGLEEFPALNELWDHESGWNHEAVNPSSGACGIPQALPCDKISEFGDPGDPAAQIRWGLNYIKNRYGTPTEALNFWNANGWY